MALGTGTDVSIRPARRDDVAAIVHLLADDVLGATREVVSDPVDAAYLVAFDAMAAQPDSHPLVAERDGHVVGCLQLTIIHRLSHRGMSRAQIEGSHCLVSARQRDRRAAAPRCRRACAVGGLPARAAHLERLARRCAALLRAARVLGHARGLQADAGSGLTLDSSL
ncbi:MAG: hypothetical protein R2712_30775 [Vicinamibacterales bacterium]